MKIMKQLSLMCLFFMLMPASIFAGTAVISNRDCPSCGQTCTDVSQVPSESYAAVSPTENFMAAISPPIRTTFYNGFFLGTGFGLGDVNYHLQVGGVNPPDLVGGDRTYLITRFSGGYALEYCHFYLALELGYQYRSRNSPTHYDDQVSFALTNSFDDGVIVGSTVSLPCEVFMDIYSNSGFSADLMPGFVYSRFLIFLRLGLETSNYNWRRQVCFPAASFVVGPGIFETTTTVNDLAFLDSNSKRGNGLRLGAGLAWAAGCHISFNLNYVHVFGSKISFTPTSGPAMLANITPINTTGTTSVSTVNILQLTANNTIQPQRDEVLFGVTFTF